MTRKYIIAIVASTASMISIIFILYAQSQMSNPIYRGPFVRKTPIIPVPTIAKIDLKHNSFYIAGIEDGNIYIGNYTAPFHAEIIDTTFKSLKKIQIQHPQIDSTINPGYFRLSTVGQQFFLSHGVSPAILHGSIDSVWQTKQTNLINGQYFDEFVPLSEKSFATRLFSKSAKGYALGKLYNSPTSNYPSKSVFEQQGDGVFSVDGNLAYNKKHSRLIYAYLYRNGVTVCDTNLVVKIRFTTIDTFRHVKIKVSEIKSDKSRILSSPPAVINADIATYGDNVFVLSNVLSKHEDATIFKRSSVVDIYSIENGTYRGSFYIPNGRDGNPPTSFGVFEKSLVAIQGREIIRYSCAMCTDANPADISPQEKINIQ